MEPKRGSLCGLNEAAGRSKVGEVIGVPGGQLRTLSKLLRESEEATTTTRRNLESETDGRGRCQIANVKDARKFF